MRWEKIGKNRTSLLIIASAQGCEERTSGALLTPAGRGAQGGLRTDCWKGRSAENATQQYGLAPSAARQFEFGRAEPTPVPRDGLACARFTDLPHNLPTAVNSVVTFARIAYKTKVLR